MLPQTTICSYINFQFSAECNPPVPARKAMFMRSDFPGSPANSSQHAPQWTHFSRRRRHTGFAGINRWPLHASMQIRAPHFSQVPDAENDVIRVAVRACTLPP